MPIIQFSTSWWLNTRNIQEDSLPGSACSYVCLSLLFDKFFWRALALLHAAHTPSVPLVIVRPSAFAIWRVASSFTCPHLACASLIESGPKLLLCMINACSANFSHIPTKVHCKNHALARRNRNIENNFVASFLEDPSFLRLIIFDQTRLADYTSKYVACCEPMFSLLVLSSSDYELFYIDYSIFQYQSSRDITLPNVPSQHN